MESGPSLKSSLATGPAIAKANKATIAARMVSSPWKLWQNQAWVAGAESAKPRRVVDSGASRTQPRPRSKSRLSVSFDQFLNSPAEQLLAAEGHAQAANLVG